MAAGKNDDHEARERRPDAESIGGGRKGQDSQASPDASKPGGAAPSGARKAEAGQDAPSSGKGGGHRR
jgi:hypothetical protein